jgi:NADPH:quinone reductase-like Zn-dependent oxidoreductase
MRAVRIAEHGGFDRLRFEDVPDPAPRAGEVRVRVEAVGLNHLDTWVRRGIPGVTYPLPLIPGCDGAGTVDAVGEGVATRRVGDGALVRPLLRVRPRARPPLPLLRHPRRDARRHLRDARDRSRA